MDDNLGAELVLGAKDDHTKAVPTKELDLHAATDHQSYRRTEEGTLGDIHHHLLAAADSLVPSKSQYPEDIVAHILQNYDCVRLNSNIGLLQERPASEEQTNPFRVAEMHQSKDARVVQSEVEDMVHYVAAEDNLAEVHCSIRRDDAVVVVVVPNVSVGVGILEQRPFGP